MIRIVTIVLVTLIAGAAVAQDCQMIMLFESGGELVDQIVAGAGPLTGHLVLYSDVDEVSAFGASLEITPPGSLFVLAMSGPNGFINYGDMDDLLVGYGTPVPTSDPTILCSFDLQVTSSAHVVICVDDVEISAGGIAYPCEGGCSEINPPVAVEAWTFSTVKGVFGG